MTLHPDIDRLRAHREIEGDQGVTVHPRYDMSMGELEDAMHSNSVTVRISAIRAAYAKGQLDGINSVGESLRVAGLL